MSLQFTEVEDPETTKNRTDLLLAQEDIRAIAGHLFRCNPEDITIRLSTEVIGSEDMIISEVLYKGKPLDRTRNPPRYFPIGPYSGFGNTVEKAILDLLLMIRIRAEETAVKLIEILKEREYPTSADINKVWSKREKSQ